MSKKNIYGTNLDNRYVKVALNEEDSIVRYSKTGCKPNDGTEAPSITLFESPSHQDLLERRNSNILPSILNPLHGPNKLPDPVTLEENKFESLAVQVCNTYFSYTKPTKKNFVLNGVNINIKKGQIYALLGPSGCGKTTLLKCITQTVKPHEGEIHFPTCQKESAQSDCKVGFMPQELSLYPELTIEETFFLFGRISGVSCKALKADVKHYTKLFDLPHKDRQVATLSGGQKRRVSFVAALLPDAPLLILDEPTVGIDPILRQTIWNYLSQITTHENKTVLLTTHYIDEAKDATNIGLMRDGEILVEASPCELMRQFNESSLEQCFYRICVNSDKEGTGEASVQEQESDALLKKNSRFKVPELRKMFCHSKREEMEVDSNLNEQKGRTKFKMMNVCSNFIPGNLFTDLKPKEIFHDTKLVEKLRNTACLINKNIKLLSRTLIMVAMQFALPAVAIFLINICIGESVTSLKIATVNEEDPVYLSNDYLKELDAFTIIKRSYPDLESAIDSVKNGENILALHIKRDFSYCLLHRLNLGVFVNNATLDCATLRIYMDNSNQILSISLHKYLLDSFERFQTAILLTLGSSPILSNLPIAFEKPLYGSMKLKFNEFFSPAILLICIHYLAAVFTGVTLILEKQSGVFERLQVSGITKLQIMAAQVATNIFVILAQVILMLLVQFLLFDSSMNGNLFYVFLLIILQGISGALMGYFLSGLTTNVNVGIMMGLGCMYTNLVFCGAVWPLQGMPTVLRWIAYFIPAVLNIEGLRSVLIKGWGLSNKYVFIGLLSVLGHCAFFFILGFILYRSKR